MTEFETLEEMDGFAGKELGKSPWVLIDQKTIDLFAEATGDHQWIHVDVERAGRELPGGHTIAHGYLTLALLPQLGATVFDVKKRSRSLNYGSNKVRFTSPVPAGSRVRLVSTLKATQPIEGGRQLTFSQIIEIEGSERPALVAETITLAYA